MEDLSKIYVSAKGLPPFIHKLGDNVVGCELGVWTAQNMGYVLQQCPNIKKCYAIDAYLPYYDWNRYIGPDEINQVKAKSEEVRSWFGDRVHFIHANSVDALAHIPDGSLDYVFVDGDHSYMAAKQDIYAYWHKVRKGGMFSGHDFSLPGVNQALSEFRAEFNITTPLQFCDNDIWLWYKE